MKTAPEDVAERVQTALDAIKYQQLLTDPGGAVREFFVNIVKQLDRTKAMKVFKDQKRFKAIIPKLITGLNPPN